MKFQHILTSALCLTLVSGAGAAYGQDSGALVDALVRKKILTPQEAENIRADLIKENTSADKIKLSGPVTELSLYGDLRLRYQYSNLDPQIDVKAPTRDPGHGTQGSKFNFRLRLNGDFKLTENWFGGVQLTTGRNTDTGSQTYDGGFRNYEIYVSRAYVGWKNDADWLTVIGGKQPDPFYTTDMVWDPNINPSGAVEQVKFHKLFGGGVEETTTTGADGKSVVSVKQAPVSSPWELTLVAGQFAFNDNNEDAWAGQNTDAFLFEEQLIFSYKFSKDVKLTVAPAYMVYNAAQLNDAVNTEPFSQLTDGLPLGVGETRNLSIIEVPGDISFKLCGVKTKVLWDFSYNTNGAKRTRDIYGVNGQMEIVKDSKGKVISEFQRSDHSSQDDMGYQVGFQLGQNVKRGDWSLLTTYRQVGLAAVDPNLNCSDFALSRVNVRGWKIGVSYSFSSAVVAQVTYFGANNLRSDLVGGQATGGARIADGNSLQLVTVDLNVKF